MTWTRWTTVAARTTAMWRWRDGALTPIPLLCQYLAQQGNALLLARVRRTPMPTTHTLTFTKEKETKNTVKFAEDQQDGKPPVVGTIYIQKWAAGVASKLVVTVELLP